MCDSPPVIAHMTMAPKVGAGPLKLHPFGMSAPSWSGRKWSAQNLTLMRHLNRLSREAAPSLEVFKDGLDGA